MPGQDGRPAWRAECGLTQPLPTSLPRRPGAGLPAPDRPLSLPLATGPAFSCHSSWSSGQELRFVLLRAWSRPKPWGRGNRHPVGLRGWDPGFRLPGVWGTLTLEREPSKRQLRMHSGCGPRTRGRFAAGLPGPPFPLRAEAPWTRSAAPCCAVPCSGPARRSHAPAGLRGVRAQLPAVPRLLRRTARNDTRPLNAPDRGEGFICWFLLSSAGLRRCRSSVMCSQTQNSECIIGPFLESFTEMISFRTLEDSLFLCSKEFWGIVKEVHI